MVLCSDLDSCDEILCFDVCFAWNGSNPFQIGEIWAHLGLNLLHMVENWIFFILNSSVFLLYLVFFFFFWILMSESVWFFDLVWLEGFCREVLDFCVLTPNAGFLLRFVWSFGLCMKSLLVIYDFNVSMRMSRSADLFCGFQSGEISSESKPFSFAVPLSLFQFQFFFSF